MPSNQCLLLSSFFNLDVPQNTMNFYINSSCTQRDIAESQKDEVREWHRANGIGHRA